MATGKGSGAGVAPRGEVLRHARLLHLIRHCLLAHTQRRSQLLTTDVILGVPQQLHQLRLPRLRPHRHAAAVGPRPRAAPGGVVLRHTRLPHLLRHCHIADAQRRRQGRLTDVILGVPQQLHQPRLPRLRPHRRVAAIGGRPGAAPRGVVLRHTRLPHLLTHCRIAYAQRCRQALRTDVVVGVPQQLHQPRLPRLRPHRHVAAIGGRPGAAPRGVVLRHAGLPHLRRHCRAVYAQRRRQARLADVVLGVLQQLHQPRLPRLRPHRHAAAVNGRPGAAPRGE
eukprot:scaffold79_cov214-Prasinococcus_capsulatus_cf.AAC.1